MTKAFANILSGKFLFCVNCQVCPIKFCIVAIWAASKSLYSSSTITVNLNKCIGVCIANNAMKKMSIKCCTFYRSFNDITRVE